jgi:quercetin dioxygenase-like cupin family protein
MNTSQFLSIHRVVTGHDDKGKAIVSSDGPLPTVVELTAIPGTLFHEVWSTSGAPAPIDNGPDPTLGPLLLAPPKQGTRLRFVDVPADTPEFLAHGAATVSAVFSQTGDASASTVKADSPHPLMHRTQTVDYGVVIEGEITLVLDDSEVTLAAGSVVIQRGTNHAWANRSGRPCRLLFVLVDGVYDPAVAAALGPG